MAYSSSYRTEQPRTARTRKGNPSPSDQKSPMDHAMVPVFENAQTHTRRLIEVMKAIQSVDLKQVTKEYRILMEKGGYKSVLEEEDAKLKSGSDGDENIAGTSGLDLAGTISAETIALKKELEKTKLELQKKEQELDKKEGLYLAGTSSAETIALKKELAKTKLELQKKEHELENEKAEHTNGLRSIQESFNSDQNKYDDQVSKLKSQLHKLKSENDFLQSKNKETSSELGTVKKEKSDALTRLSKVMGTKLTDNNPNIADLSDQNRATKLGEKFSELYDDEWTDALETLTENRRMTDEKAIKVLLDTLKFCFTYSKKKAEDQMKSLEILLKGPEQTRKNAWDSKKSGLDLPQAARKQLKDLRKSVAAETKDILYEGFQTDKDRGGSVLPTAISKIPDYVKKCLELCWFMAVQDPPVALGPEMANMEKFDTNLYRHYTTTGDFVDYIVWPPLCLHEGGPILCKGVAQPFSSKETRDRTHGRAKSAPATRMPVADQVGSNGTGRTRQYLDSQDKASEGAMATHVGKTGRVGDREYTKQAYQSVATFDPLQQAQTNLGRTDRADDWEQFPRQTYQSTNLLDPYQQTQTSQYPYERRSPRPEQQQVTQNQYTSYGRGQRPVTVQGYAQSRTPSDYRTEVVPTTTQYSNYKYMYGNTVDESYS